MTKYQSDRCSVTTIHHQMPDLTMRLADPCHTNNAKRAKHSKILKPGCFCVFTLFINWHTVSSVRCAISSSMRGGGWPACWVRLLGQAGRGGVSHSSPRAGCGSATPRHHDLNQSTVCVECLIGKQKKPTLFKVTEQSSAPYRTPPACAKMAAYPDPGWG